MKIRAYLIFGGRLMPYRTACNTAGITLCLKFNCIAFLIVEHSTVFSTVASTWGQTACNLNLQLHSQVLAQLLLPSARTVCAAHKQKEQRKKQK